MMRRALAPSAALPATSGVTYEHARKPAERAADLSRVSHKTTNCPNVARDLVPVPHRKQRGGRAPLTAFGAAAPWPRSYTAVSWIIFRLDIPSSRRVPGEAGPLPRSSTSHWLAAWQRQRHEMPLGGWRRQRLRARDQRRRFGHLASRLFLLRRRCPRVQRANRSAVHAGGYRAPAAGCWAQLKRAWRFAWDGRHLVASD